MSLVIWRLHRNQVRFATAMLVVLAVLLLVTGVHMADDYRRALVTCGATRSCGNLSDTLFQGDGLIVDLVLATAVVPLLFGLFWGTPLVSKEMEDGTHAFAWTQSITRRRWLSSNVLWALAAAVVWGAVMSALVYWWRYPGNALGSRFGAFDVQGLVPIAYSVFAVALGIAAGSLLRRLLPALAITLGTFTVVRVVVEVYVRPHFMTPVRQLFALSNNGFGAPGGAWLLSRVVVSPSGRVTSLLSEVPAACHSAVFGNSLLPCLQQQGYRRLVTYQPDGRFWAFQGIESGLFVVLAAALLAVAYRQVLRRDA